MPFRHRRAGSFALCVLCALIGANWPSAALAQPRAEAPAPPAAKPAKPLTPAELVRLAEEVQKEVEKLRDWKFKHAVKKDVYTEEQLRKFIEKRVFEEEYGGGKLQQKQTTLRLLGLIPADCDLRKTFTDVLLNQVGGFYDPPTQAFYMLQRSGVDYGPLVTRILVAHELTHALDDQYFDLDKLMKSHEQTEDWAYTIGAVVEGSATALMSRYAADAIASGKYDMGELQDVMESEMQRSQAFLEAPPYFSTLLANYLCGMMFVLKGDLLLLGEPTSERTVGENLKRIVKRPPESSEQILHPDKYWDDKQREGPVVVDDAAVERILRDLGWSVVARDTVGELLCAIMTESTDRRLDAMAAMVPDYWTNDAATGWGGDRFYLLRPAGESTASDAETAAAATHALWITVWDTDEDRDEFARAYQRERPSKTRHAIPVSKRGTIFLFGFDAAARTALEPALNAAALKLARDGKPWNVDEKR